MQDGNQFSMAEQLQNQDVHELLEGLWALVSIDDIRKLIDGFVIDDGADTDPTSYKEQILEEVRRLLEGQKISQERIENLINQSRFSKLLKQLGNSVPVQEIHNLISKSGSDKTYKHLNKYDLLDEVKKLFITRQISLQDLEKTISDYKFAGRVSVCWSIPLNRVAMSRKDLESLLAGKFSVNPFEQEIRPELSKEPEFNSAEWLSEDLLRLEFTYAGKSFEVEDNYEKKIIIPTHRINSYIRLVYDTFVVETRANIRTARMVRSAVSALFDTEVVPLRFANSDIDIIKEKLKAKSRAVKYKYYGGELDTVSISASPGLSDLADSKNLANFNNGGELKEVRFEYTYKDKDGNATDVSLHISSIGNIWFMSGVPESVIENVFSIIRSIKFVPPIRRLGLSSDVNDADLADLQRLLYLIRKHGYGKRFNPRIYKQLKFDLANERPWIETISKLVQSGYLLESFELCCPDCHETIEVYRDFHEIPLDQEMHCTHCHSGFKVSEDDIILMYSFKDVGELEENLSPSTQSNEDFLVTNEG